MSNEQVSKYIICYLYGLNPEVTKIYIITHDDHIEANYKNADGQLIDNKIRFDGDKVVWGAKTGRWRTHAKDSIISYEVKGDSITVTEHHFMRKATSKTFKIIE